MALHGFSSHSTGGGAGPVQYFIDTHYFDKENEIWSPRDPLPEVVEGDPVLMIKMIDSLEHKHKYTSGVISFTHNDTEKLKAVGMPEAIADISDRLKDMLFAGIATEYRHILIVKQTHLDRLELHYVLPRHNFEVGRSWNPAPPGEGKFRQMDALMDFINIKYGLDDPRDPLRARATKAPGGWLTKDENYTREKLHDIFKQAVIDGAVNSRIELIEMARSAGFEITRTGSNYIAMKAPGQAKSIRLKGEIYDDKFTSRAELANTKTKVTERADSLAKSAVVERYKQAFGERKTFVEKRFAKALSCIRTGENHQEVEKYNNAKRGQIIKVGRNDNNPFSVNNSNTFTNNKNGMSNDRFGTETDAVIARAERVIGNTQHATEQTDRILYQGAAIVAAGITVTKSANQRLGDTSIGLIAHEVSSPVTPSTPLDIASDIGGAMGSMDSGDSEADKIVNKKRSEFGSLNNKLRQIEAANKKNSDGYSPI